MVGAAHRRIPMVLKIRSLALYTFACALALLQAPGAARAQDYAAILAAGDRSDAERQTDKRREALQMLTFIGPKAGWNVLDMGADAGYSTELMARSVAPNGKV